MTRALLVLIFVGFSAWGGDAGRVSYELFTRPDFDHYTNAPGGARQRWFREHLERMIVYSPYFDNKTPWFPQALVYIDLYGVHPDTAVAREHPDWLLHDSAARTLYVPWGCANGTCPQFAADIANPKYRAWFIYTAKSLLRRGYLGLFLDDVNMEFRVSDGTGKQAVPIDSTMGQPMSWDAWRNHVADFVEEIRKALPKTEIIHNSIWYAGPGGIRDRDPAIQRQIKAANYVNVERGIGSDPGLTGGDGQWSLSTLFAYIDRVHALGRGVTMQQYRLDLASREYSLAGYFLISSGDDLYSDGNATPDDWWVGYDVDLGGPMGPRTYRDGVFERKFSCGMVVLGEPGLHSRNVPLGGSYTSLDGRSVHSVDVSARQGMVLRSCGPATTSKETRSGKH